MDFDIFTLVFGKHFWLVLDSPGWMAAKDKYPFHGPFKTMAEANKFRKLVNGLTVTKDWTTCELDSNNFPTFYWYELEFYADEDVPYTNRLIHRVTNWENWGIEGRATSTEMIMAISSCGDDVDFMGGVAETFFNDTEDAVAYLDVQKRCIDDWQGTILAAD